MWLSYVLVPFFGDGSHFCAGVQLEVCFLDIQLQGGEPCLVLFCSNHVQEGCVKQALACD